MKYFKKNLILPLLIILLNSIFLFDCIAQTWVQVKHASSNSYCDNKDIAVDNNGNVYVVGNYSGDSYFDTDTITAQTDGDFFIAKYSVNGDLLWIKHGAGYTLIDGLTTSANSVTLIGDDEIFITGTFPGTMLIDTIQLVSHDGQSNDIFIAKFDSLGNCIWAKSAGGNATDNGAAIVSDNYQYLYITGDIGTYLTNVYFETDTIPLSTSDHRFFLAKYDHNGNFKWVKSSTGPGYNEGTCISFKEENIYVGGTYDSVSSFGQVNLISSGNSDILILKYDSSGNALWGKSASEPEYPEHCLGISNDDAGNCYMTGYFIGSITFDSNTVLICAGQIDCFIAKYSFDGDFLWAKQISASQQGMGWGIQTDSSGNSYITGKFLGSATFGNFHLNSSPQADLFIAKFDSGGICIGVRNVHNSISTAVSTDANGSSYIIGNVSDTAVFDSYTIFPNSFLINIFWAKLGAFSGINEEERNASNQLIIYANPSQGKCNISVPEEFLHEKFLTLTIFDNAGKVIQNGSLQMDENQILINIEAEAKGIYNVILSNGKRSYSGKIIFE